MAPPETASRALVLGGGFAGMAAAITLADAGQAVTVLEARARLGGRAYSLRDRTSGDVIDNGQHAFTGACHGVLDFCRRMGTQDQLWLQDDLRLDFLDTDGPPASLVCPPLPAPAHLLAGLLRVQGLGWSDRLSALRIGSAIRSLGRPGVAEELDSITAEQWFDRTGQTEATRRLLWRPLALAIVNEDTAVASALPLARALAESFLGSRSNSRMILAAAGLSNLYEEAFPRFLAARGGEVLTLAGARSLRFRPCGDGDAVQGITLRDGRTLDADLVISAVPHYALPSLLPEAWRSRAPFAGIEKLGTAPIVSVHLWFDREVTPHRFLGLLGTEAQWVFNREAIAGDVSGHSLSMIYSAAHAQVKRSAAELTAQCVEDLRRLLPAAREAKVLSSRVIKEHRATFSARPGTNALRPGAETPIRGFFLAGDWTATGLPATIESAIRSGYAAGKAALAAAPRARSAAALAG